VVREQWLQALDGVCSIVQLSKSSFGGSNRSILATPQHLDVEYDIIVSSLASMTFFFLFPFLLNFMLAF